VAAKKALNSKPKVVQAQKLIKTTDRKKPESSSDESSSGEEESSDE